MGSAGVVRGRVLRFDQVKGYGFVAPDGGGEDVFLHVNDLLEDKHLIHPGALVEFVVEQGDRGLKASSVQLVHHPVRGVQMSQTAFGDERRIDDTSTAAPAPAEGGPANGDIVGRSEPVVTPGAGKPRDFVGEVGADDWDETVDVLSREELLKELTEMLLVVDPPLTGPQILCVRERMTSLCNRHGWVEG